MALGIGSGLSFGSSLQKDCSWFKAVYPANQDNASGIALYNQFATITASAGDTFTITCRIYLTGSSGTWDAGTDDVSTKFTMGGQTVSVSPIPQNQVVNIDATSNAMPSSWSDNFFVWWSEVSDLPDAAAELYISDMKIVIKDSGGSIKATNEYDFSENGNISMISDYSIQGGTLSKSKGNCLS